MQVSVGARLANLCFCDESMRSFDANLKVNPPLRSQEHVAACLAALADGTIDVLTSGHQPRALEKKMQELSAAPFGMSTLDTAVAQMVTHLIRPGHVSWSRAVDAFSARPARVLGIDAGSLAVGKSADVVVIDPEVQWAVTPDQFHSRSRNSPLLGQQLYGRAEKVWVAGVCKYDRNVN